MSAALLGTVTIRFQRLTADSVSNIDGFSMHYGCTGATTSDNHCKQTPILLMTSDSQQSSACGEHIAVVLQSLIDDALRTRNGERGHGFLHRHRTAPALRANVRPPSTTKEVVWQNRLDGRYDVAVFRSSISHVGVLVLRDGPAEIFRTSVRLSFNALFGPDACDVQEWCDTATAVIDQSKPVEQVIREAVDRVENVRRRHLTQLLDSPQAGEAYRLAFDLFGLAEASVEWLLSANASLRGSAPVEILNDADGLERLGRLLDDVARTIYPLS